MNALRLSFKIPGVSWWLSHTYGKSDPRLAVSLWGIEFPNRVGLAAGFDKEGANLKELAALGFGHIEMGTITPVGQPGNPKPRLFRLKHSEGLINRMGFNNPGTEIAIEHLKKIKNRNFIIGGNIGKNKDTPNENAVDDYLRSWEALYPYVDYFVVNISSPNTPNLRQLQEKEPLKRLLGTLKNKALSSSKNKPLILKISPDLSHTELDDILEIVLEMGLDGILATNTTLARKDLDERDEFIKESGGLSGKPILNRSTEFIRYIHLKTQGKIPIIGVGGISSPEDAWEKIEAGASLVQIYTGFIFEGPRLIKRINQFLLKKFIKA